MFVLITFIQYLAQRGFSPALISTSYVFNILIVLITKNNKSILSETSQELMQAPKKILIVGEANTGKTALIRAFLEH